MNISNRPHHEDDEGLSDEDDSLNLSSTMHQRQVQQDSMNSFGLASMVPSNSFRPSSQVMRMQQARMDQGYAMSQRDSYLINSGMGNSRYAASMMMQSDSMNMMEAMMDYTIMQTRQPRQYVPGQHNRMSNTMNVPLRMRQLHQNQPRNLIMHENEMNRFPGHIDSRSIDHDVDSLSSASSNNVQSIQPTNFVTQTKRKERAPSTTSFPTKLYKILADPQYKEVVSWLPHGRAWRVLKPKSFEEDVIPKFFRSDRYASFMRQVRRTFLDLSIPQSHRH